MKKKIMTIAIASLIIIIKPLGMDIGQSILLAGLLLTIIWWTTGIVDKTYSSIFLLIVFVLFGRTPLNKIFHFLLSDTFIMIVFSFLFSQGISNSKLADKLLQPILFKYADNLLKLMMSVFLIQVTMIFVIPQPFSRVIIISLIFTEYYNKLKLDDKTKNVLLFWLYASSVHINMFTIRGDIILNNALLTIANYPLDELTWIKYMLVPSFLFYLLSMSGFLLLFRKDLIKYNTSNIKKTIIPQELDKNEKIQLTFIISVVVIWATESIHGISGTIIVVIGTSVMFFIKLLEKKDLGSVNINLLIFLTAAFSIGNVLKTSGTSDILFSKFMNFFPGKFSNHYIFMVFITSVVLHMILGSNVTTLSVVVPGLMTIGAGTAKPEITMFLIFFSVCSHFVFPFHSVIMLIGDGNKHYKTDTILKFAPLLTILAAASVFLIYTNWWKTAGLL